MKPISNIEYKANESFPIFLSYIKGKRVTVISDANTHVYSLDIIGKMQGLAKEVKSIYFDLKDLVPNESVYERAILETKGFDYILAVGSGSLNDVSKYVAKCLGIESGCFATAPSMDGYLSKGAAIMVKGIKETIDCNTPHDILIDLDVLSKAPRLMIASGFGDIMGKFTCLTDWRLSHIINGEEIHQEGYKMMEDALLSTYRNIDKLKAYDKQAISTLMDALLTAGTSMAIVGNSRPASGSEHHQSHFLEMDFCKKGLPIPLHGLKVGIGTLLSIELYNHLKETKKNFPHKPEILELVNELPNNAILKKMYAEIGSPSRFSELGVQKDVFIDMVKNAYKVRNRYSILTFYHDFDLTDEVLDSLIEKYF